MKHKCVLCQQGNGALMARQVRRPDEVFYSMADKNGYIFYHPKCVQDYQKKLEAMS